MAFRSSLLVQRAFSSSAYKPVITKSFQNNVVTQNLFKKSFSTKTSPEDLNSLPDDSAKIQIGAHTVVDTGDFIISEASPDYTGPKGREPLKLINEVPPFEVEGRRAICDGGGGPLGHPKVFINLDKGKPVACGYCGIRFVQKDHHGHH